MEKLNIPLYQRLYEDIKYKIRRNEYKKNTKLESIRSLAKKLDISTTTVEKAYNQLLIEGYIESMPRSGYVVLAVDLLEHSIHKPLVDPIITPFYPNTKLTSDTVNTEITCFFNSSQVTDHSSTDIMNLKTAGSVRIKCDIAGGGSIRGAHNCKLCDHRFLDAVYEFSLSQNINVFKELDCNCKEKWLDQLDIEDLGFGSLVNI